MPFPKIRACLIAEDTREERYRKITVLGLYGITPDVEIALQDITKPIPITFMLFGGPGEGKYRVRPRLVSEQGVELIQVNPYEIEFPPGTSVGGHNLMINIPVIKFPGRGLYRFILEIDGQSHYETSFRIRPGLPQEFQ